MVASNGENHIFQHLRNSFEPTKDNNNGMDSSGSKGHVNSSVRLNSLGSWRETTYGHAAVLKMLDVPDNIDLCAYVGNSL